MTGRKVYREVLRVAFAAAVVLVGVWGLPADLSAAPEAESAAVALPAARLVTAAPAEYSVEATDDEVVERPSDFGPVYVDSGLQVAGKETSANVIAFPAGGPQVPDGASFSFEESPLPVPDGATVLETRIEGSLVVTSSVDPQRSATEVLDFYRSAFSTDITVVERAGRDGVVKLLLFAADRNVGWVLVAEGTGGVTATVAWHL